LTSPRAPKTDAGKLTETTASLLRAASRIAWADAALMSIVGDGVHSMFGLSAAEANDLNDALLVGADLPGGWFVLWSHKVVTMDHAREMRMFLLSSTPGLIDESTDRTLGLLAAEMGSLVDLGAGKERRSAIRTPGGRMKQFVDGVDSLADPAVVLQAPRTGDAPTFLHVNPAFEKFFGYSHAEVLGQNTNVLLGQMSDIERVGFMRERLRAGHEARSVIAFYRRNGIPAWFEVHLRSIREPNGATLYQLMTFRDVTARREFEAALGAEKQKLQVTLAAIGDAVVTTVGDGRVEFVNDAARRIFAIDSVSSYGEPINTILPLSDAGGDPIDLLTSGEEDTRGVRRGQASMFGVDGPRHIAYVVSPIGNTNDGYVVVLRDITTAHRLSTQLSHEAAHDPLTGLSNRRRFEEALEELITKAHNSAVSTVLAALDLDRFKVINDRCGHAAGDRVLVEIAGILAERLREHDLLARVGGDEFAILLYDCSLESARRVLDDIRRAVDAYRFVHAGETFTIGVSIGLATIDERTADGASALATADKACYAAKAAGGHAIIG
jgi:diguanylate cyclase (GGDEF)-like protein/PAS domain S-box-containing protein